MRLGLILLAMILLMVANTAMAHENLTIANKSESNSSALNSSALKDLILSSTIKPDTYIFTLDMNQRIEMSNITAANKTESQTISTRSFGLAELNLTAKAMKIVMATLAIPEGQEDSTSTTATEMYLLNDTMYIKVDGNWTKLILVGPTLGSIWKQEDEIEKQRGELNNSTITLIGDEKVDGIDCYKINVVPNFMANNAMDEGYNIGIQGSRTGSSMISYLNVSSLLNNTNISETMWIAKETHLPMKVDISMNMALSTEQLGIPTKKAGNIEMKIDTSEVIVFSGINKKLNIILPEDAKRAVAFPSSILVSGNSTLMNSTSKNSSSKQ